MPVSLENNRVRVCRIAVNAGHADKRRRLERQQVAKRLSDLTPYLPLSDHVAEEVSGNAAELRAHRAHGRELRRGLEGQQTAGQSANCATKALLPDKAAEGTTQG